MPRQSHLSSPLSRHTPTKTGCTNSLHTGTGPRYTVGNLHNETTCYTPTKTGCTNSLHTGTGLRYRVGNLHNETTCYKPTKTGWTNSLHTGTGLRYRVGNLHNETTCYTPTKTGCTNSLHTGTGLRYRVGNLNNETTCYTPTKTGDVRATTYITKQFPVTHQLVSTVRLVSGDGRPTRKREILYERIGGWCKKRQPLTTNGRRNNLRLTCNPTVAAPRNTLPRVPTPTTRSTFGLAGGAE